VARGALVDAEHPEHGAFRQVGPIFAGMRPPTGPYDVRDDTVTDTADVLVAAGFTAAECDDLRGVGAIA
jgi:hypothetical protein